MMDGSKKHNDEYTKESGTSTTESKAGSPHQVLKPIGRSAASGHMTQLAHDFEPGEQDVVCGRGKKCYSHRGNAVFRELVMTFLDEYSGARNKVDKSAVLNKVVEEVRLRSPHGGFVKQDAEGVWHEVGDFLAREKTSQAFRDALHDRYKSSNVSKKKRRQEEQAKVPTKEPRGDYDISSRLERLSNEVMLGQGIDNIDDFNRNNYEMLSRLNRVSHAKRSSMSPRHYDPLRPSSSSSYGRPFPQNFPDPLFGPSTNAAIPPSRPLTTSHDDRLTPGHHYESGQRATMRQQFSFATAPESSAAVEPLLPYSHLESASSSFHHSLPNIHYHQQDDRIDPFDDESLHQSMPNITVSQHETISEQSGKMPSVKTVEPIPFHRINLMGRPKEAYHPSSSSTMKPSLDESIPAESTSSTLLSRDLIECLDKMTCHSIHDSNPFEPIPLTPQQERKIAMVRRQQLQQLQQQQQQQQLLHPLKPMEEQLSSEDSAPSIEPLDDSERIDEFAEG